MYVLQPDDSLLDPSLICHRFKTLPLPFINWYQYSTHLPAIQGETRRHDEQRNNGGEHEEYMERI